MTWSRDTAVPQSFILACPEQKISKKKGYLDSWPSRQCVPSLSDPSPFAQRTQGTGSFCMGPGTASVMEGVRSVGIEMVGLEEEASGCIRTEGRGLREQNGRQTGNFLSTLRGWPGPLIRKMPTPYRQNNLSPGLQAPCHCMGQTEVGWWWYRWGMLQSQPCKGQGSLQGIASRNRGQQEAGRPPALYLHRLPGDSMRSLSCLFPTLT